MGKTLKIKNLKVTLKASNTVFVLGAFLSLNAYAQNKKIERITSPDTAYQTAQQLEQQENAENNSVKPTPYGAASDLNRHSVGLGIGQTFLNGGFHDNAESSITPDLYYNYSASYSFDLLVNFHYSKQEKGQTSVRTLGLAPGIKAKFYQFDNFAPFALGGLGFYNPTEERVVNGQLRESDGKWVFGYHFGGGVELKLNPHFTVGAMFHFHNPFDVKQDVGGDVEGSYQKLMLTTFYTF